MSITLCISIAWVTFCLLLVGLVFISLLIVERASNTSQANTSQAMVAGERISDQARHTAMLDLAMDEPVRQARELADTFDALAQLEGTVTLAPRDTIRTARSQIAPSARMP